MKGVVDFLNGHAKALFSGLVAGVLMYLTLKTDGLTAGDWTTIVVTMVSAGGAAWAIPNTGPFAPMPPRAMPPRPTGTGVNI